MGQVDFNGLESAELLRVEDKIRNTWNQQIPYFEQLFKVDDQVRRLNVKLNTLTGDDKKRCSLEISKLMQQAAALANQLRALQGIVDADKRKVEKLLEIPLAEVQQLIKRHEDSKPFVYTDTKGHPTVGIGINLDASDSKKELAAVGADYDAVRKGKQGLTEDQIRQLFQMELEKSLRRLRQTIPKFDRLPKCCKLVIIDLQYNLGDVKTKWPTFTKKVNEGDLAGALKEIEGNKKWGEQVKSRARDDIEIFSDFPNQ